MANNPLRDNVRRRLRVAQLLGVIPPPPPKVRFKDYVESVVRDDKGKLLKLDPFQIDLCDRLETAFWCSQAKWCPFEDVEFLGTAQVRAPSGLLVDKDVFEGKRNRGSHVAIHAFPQAGKSIIISRSYPCWIFGYQPTHRFRLATYNEGHSRRFSGAIRRQMQSPEHRLLFPDPAGFVPVRAPAKEWSTAARIALNSDQPSFIGLGLKTGFTGTGFDTLLIDDPYKTEAEAYSEVIRESTWRFYEATAHPRSEDHSNEFIMFHRYHQDDMGGRALLTKRFVLWRYAAIADGLYLDEETGLSWPCLPLGRPEGEFLTRRRSDAWYEDLMKSKRVWLSMYQGRPVGEAGNMFDVRQIRIIDLSEVPPIIHFVRAWDNAATKDGGAFTAGGLMGIDAKENVYIFDMARDQVNTAGRDALQEATAAADGKMVLIHGPQDPGSAGTDIAFLFEQKFTALGYSVLTEPVSGSKEARAHNFSIAVNRGQCFAVRRLRKAA